MVAWIYGACCVLWGILIAILVPLHMGTIQGYGLILGFILIGILLIPLAIKEIRAEYYRRQINPKALQTILRYQRQLLRLEKQTLASQKYRENPDAYASYLLVIKRAKWECNRMIRVLETTDCRGKRVTDEPWLRLLTAFGSSRIFSEGLAQCKAIMVPR